MLLAALPEACRRRLPDVSTTGPRLFAFLVEQGLLAALPSPRLIPAVLALVADVSPLLQARSSRQWTLWLARVRDADSPIAAAIRQRTPPSQLDVVIPPPAARPLRATTLRVERDRLAGELAAEKSETEQLRQEYQAMRQRLVKLASQAALFDRQERALAQVEADLPVLRQKLEEMEGSSTTLIAERDKDRRERAEIRRLLGVPDADPRSLADLVAAEVQARHELAETGKKLRQRCTELEAAGKIPSEAKAASETAKARAEKAERSLAAVRADLDSARVAFSDLREKHEAKKFRLHSVQRQLEALEIELAEERAELEVRTGRLIPPFADEIWTVRHAAANKARALQRKRRPLTADDDGEAE